MEQQTKKLHMYKW